MKKRKLNELPVRERWKRLLLIGLCSCISISIFANEFKSQVNLSLNNATLIKQVQKQEGFKVNGKVIDKDGPLVGVYVMVKGSMIGKITDRDGNYEIMAPYSKASLVFSYVGYQPQEIKLDEKSVVDVIMVEDVKTLDEVVAIGYGTMKRTDVATAITTVKPDEFNLSGGSNRDVRTLLEGRVAGLSVTRKSGSTPLSSVAIQLRGVVSINGSKSPLVIIDGIPGGNLSLVRAEDIESIEVLKDGSAAAIYGSSANAGVIIVTTKKGKAGKTTFEYSTYVGKYFQANTPDFLNSDEYRAAMKSLGYNASAYDRGGDSDMYEALINKSNISHSHTLSVSGGSGTTNYRAALYYSNLMGVSKDDSRQQYGGRLSLTTKGLNNKLTLQTDLSTNNDYQDRLGDSGWEAARRANPTNPIYNADGSFYEDVSSDENKLARLSQQKFRRNANTTGADAKVILEPIKDLKISVMGSLTRDTYDDNKYYNIKSRTSIDSYNSGGYAYKYHYVDNQTAIEPTVEYAKILFEKHKFTVLGGYSWQQDLWESFSANNSGFLNDATAEDDLGAGSYLTTGKAGMSSTKEKSNLIAFL